MSMRKPFLLYSLTAQEFGSFFFEGGFVQAAKSKTAKVNREHFIFTLICYFLGNNAFLFSCALRPNKSTENWL
jgi:hypothetical protein